MCLINFSVFFSVPLYFFLILFLVCFWFFIIHFLYVLSLKTISQSLKKKKNFYVLYANFFLSWLFVLLGLIFDLPIQIVVKSVFLFKSLDFRFRLFCPSILSKFPFINWLFLYGFLRICNLNHLFPKFGWQNLHELLDFLRYLCLDVLQSF